MNRIATFNLDIDRFIQAKREDVFNAFISEELARKWICPRGMSVAEISLDARAGGRIRITMRSRNGEDYTVCGEYRDITPPERLEFTWQWEGDDLPRDQTLVSVTFEAIKGGTQVRMHHSGFAEETVRDSHRQGWSSSFNRLVDATDDRGSAATLELVGIPRSTYTRSVRMALAEKGLTYRMSEARPHTPDILAINPFGRIPVLRDGEVALYESTAILRYIDECFDGQALIPTTTEGRTLCEQWTSAIKDYYYDAMVKRYTLQYLIPRGPDNQPNREVINGAAKDMVLQFAELDRAYAKSDFLAGNQLSIADLLIAPILDYVEAKPEGKELMTKSPNVQRAQKVLRARASYVAALP